MMLIKKRIKAKEQPSRMRRILAGMRKEKAPKLRKIFVARKQKKGIQLEYKRLYELAKRKMRQIQQIGQIQQVQPTPTAEGIEEEMPVMEEVKLPVGPEEPRQRYKSLLDKPIRSLMSPPEHNMFGEMPQESEEEQIRLKKKIKWL